MKKFASLSFLTCLLLADPCLAEESQPTSGAEAAAIELMEITNSREILDQTMGQIEAMMQQQLATMDLSPEARTAQARVVRESMEWMEEVMSWDKMQQAYVEIYVEVFTEEELRELVAFYQTPIGQKMIEKMPALMQKSMEVTMEMIQEQMPELQRRMEQALAEIDDPASADDAPRSSED